MRNATIRRILMACLMLGMAIFNFEQAAAQNKVVDPNQVPPAGVIAATPAAEEPQTDVQSNQPGSGRPIALPAPAGALPPGNPFNPVPFDPYNVPQQAFFQPGQAVDQETEEVSRLHALDAQLGQQAESLVGQLAEQTDQRQRAETKEKLQDVLSQQFDAQQKVRELEVARVEAKLKKLRDLITKRSDARRTILEKRLEQLIREADGLGWSSPAGGGFQYVPQTRVEMVPLNGSAVTPPAGNTPRLEGLVLTARQNGLVEISLGHDDGLRVGEHAYVYRQRDRERKLVAEMKFVEVEADKSIGTVIRQFGLGSVENDDRVATRPD